jgi:hypothetical protein
MWTDYRFVRVAALSPALAVFLGVSANALGQPGPAASRFDKEIAPIFRQHCVSCHGPQRKRGGLDLSTPARLFAGSSSGPVLVKGSAEKSVLFEKVANRTMPPPEKKHPLSDRQIAIVRKWIDEGAAGAGAVVAIAKAKDPVVADTERAFWAFRKPVAGPVPAVKAARQVRTPVDAFLLAKLEAKGLTFSPDAANATLLRRAYLDLLGLPPPPDAVRAFLADDRPDAYERLIDRLLDSPHYGERWGRHWLDVAGYTDEPHMDDKGKSVAAEDWRYRDYVVRAFNQDKPYDRFLTEQLAGDELVDWRAAAKYTPEILDALTATGYLRTVPDWTHADMSGGPLRYQYDTLARVVENVSTGVLGLTLGCARCHSHKFEPIPHEDYYRLMAVFASAYNLDDWLRPVARTLPAVGRAEQEEVERFNARVDARLAERQKRLDGLRRPHRERLFAARLATVPAALRDDLRAALDTPAAKRDEVQQYLVSKLGAAVAVSEKEITAVLSPPEKAAAAKLEQEIAALQRSRRSFPRLQALWDVGQLPAVHQLLRGSADTPGPVVDAGFVTVLCPPGQSAAVRPPDVKGPSSGRRLALAHWLTRRDHPLTSRVLVNRVWAHHFGKGIVATPENFGHSGAPPTHPELLDWLAVDFMEHGWSVNRLHRLLMTSTAYRQSARRPPDGLALTADPDNDLLWRMNLRRLEAEALRDAVLAVSGQLDRTMDGPPIPVEARPDGLVTVAHQGPTPTSQWRRSLYVRSLRSSRGFVLSWFEVFDYPDMPINCTWRTNSTTPLQSLALTNSAFMLEQARSFAERVRGIAGPDAEQVAAAFVMALGRAPTAEETRSCVAFLQTQRQRYLRLKEAPEQAARRALAGLCSVLLASNEFLYIG